MSIPKNAIKVFSWILYDAYQWNQEQFDWTYKIFEWLKWKDAAQVLLIFDDWEVWIWYEEQPWRPPFFGLLGWVIEAWEQPITAIKRELLEETWLECTEYIPFRVFSPMKSIVRSFHCFLWRWVRESAIPSPEAWEAVEVIKISLEELMEIMSWDYFRTKDFALEIFREYYAWWIDRVRASLGIWDSIKENEEVIYDEIVPIKKTRIKLKAIKKELKVKKEAKTIVKKKKEVKPKLIKKKIIKPKTKKIILKKPIKKRDSLTIGNKKWNIKKVPDFKSFLDQMEKDIKKKADAFEEPLF